MTIIIHKTNSSIVYLRTSTDIPMGVDSYTYETVRKIKSFILFNNTSGLNTIRFLNNSRFLLVIRIIESNGKGTNPDSLDISRMHCPIKITEQYPMTDISN